MAKHIQHRYTKNTDHVFNKDELLLGEIGVNIGSGTLSILDESKKKVHEFINKENISELVDNVTSEINNTLSDIDQRVATIEEGNLKVDLSDYATNESVDEKIGELDQKLNYEEGFTRIISSTEAPTDTRYLWLDEGEEDLPVDDEGLSDLRSMQRAIAELTRTVRQLQALTQKIDCGKVTESSTRKTMMASATPEPVDGYFDTGVPVLLTQMRENDAIKSVQNYYLATDLSYGVELKTNGWHDVVLNFDETNKYLWSYIATTYESDNVENSEPSLMMMYDDTRVVDTFSNLYAISDSSETYPENKDNAYSETIPEYNPEKTYLWCYIKPKYITDEDSDKPNYEEYEGSNVKHLIIKSSNTEQEIRDNLNNILNGEMIWCEGNNGLYIKSKGKLIKINGASGLTPDDENEIDEIMTGITFISDGVGAIDFISKNKKKYTMKVADDGKLSVYNSALDELHPAPTGDEAGKEGDDIKALFLQKLYINSLYCGGLLDSNGNPIDEHSQNPCSHNFVELSNLTDEDINLNGLSLQYASQGTDWKVLPLWGVIKAGSTFLIRGAQCSIMNLNTTVIKVEDYDMEWRDSEGELIKFDNKSAKFYLTYGTNACTVKNPYNYNTTKPEDTTVRYGYIDLVGLNDSGNNPGGCENTSYGQLNSNRLFKKYYAMDNVKQATKAREARNNSKDWYYIDLTRKDILRDIELYTPRASSYGKNIFYDKSGLHELKPTIATITFGIQATDNTKNGGSGATRCFNWVSKGYYDEYLWYRKKGASTWIREESIKGQTDNIGKYYNRIIQEASNGDVFTSHKLIVTGLTGKTVEIGETGETVEAVETYEYTCGKSLANGEPNFDACIDIREFKVFPDSQVENFKFIQVSDQQGFNWDEYQVWKYVAKYISENHTDVRFLINTGDMTQNGNRLNEWIDYFDAKESLNNIEEMATIGNNDLCPKVVYFLGDGEDVSKINFANINFFYTFEMDPQNPPIFSDGTTTFGFIPSIYSFNYGKVHFLCLNSEISENTESIIFDIPNTNRGIIYEKIKEWCEKDIQLNSGSTWNIAYCHEMPFTIITDKAMAGFYDTDLTKGKEVPSKNNRGGSRMNIVTKTKNKYWFSQFCQNNNIRLVMGGHKHTQAISWPLKENVDDNGNVNSMKPIIQVTQSDLNNYFNSSTHLITINDSSELNGQSFPNTWFITGSQYKTEATQEEIATTDLRRNCHFCTFELVTDITAPVYSMSQATGYKHTSNKELPAERIPWCRHYFPSTRTVVGEEISSTVNKAQRYPFYTVYNVTEDYITIDVKRVQEVIVEGVFNINVQGESLKNGTKKVSVDNGLNPTDFNTDKKVIIEKYTGAYNKEE